MTTGSTPDHPLVTQLGPEAIASAVAKRYGTVATNPQSPAGFPVGRTFAESVGYPAELLDSLPPSCADTFTGAGNPHAFVSLAGVTSLLDLGCGAGLDLIRYAQQIPQPRTLVGLDFSEEMIKAAQRHLKDANIDARVICAPASAIPLPDESVDLVTANGIFNLSPDKPAIAHEAYRVLKPHGRMTFAEIILTDTTATPAQTLDEWFRCTGGALSTDALTRLMQSAGFANVQVHETTRNARTGHPSSRSAVITAHKPAHG